MMLGRGIIDKMLALLTLGRKEVNMILIFLNFGILFCFTKGRLYN